MSTTKSAQLDTKVITGKVRLSYAHIWEPKAIQEGQEPKYSTSLIIPKSDKKTIAAINQAVKNAAENGKAKFGGKIPPNLKSPLRDGDVDRSDDENYANCYFINANSKTKPGILDENGRPEMDQTKVYSGCYARVSLTFYPFNTSGNKGVACGLNHIMKMEDGEPLSGRTTAESDFKEFMSNQEVEDDLLS